jgi:hypothetical protein
MKTTLKFFVYIFVLFIHCHIQAQTLDSAREAQIDALKEYREALFVEKLKLSSIESKDFFPVYDLYVSELKKAKKVFRNKWKKNTIETLTEAEALEYYNDAIALQQKEIDLFKDACEKLKLVIPMTKIVLISKCEREIRIKLIEKADKMKVKRVKPKPKSNVESESNIK